MTKEQKYREALEAIVKILGMFEYGMTDIDEIYKLLCEALKDTKLSKG